MVSLEELPLVARVWRLRVASMPRGASMESRQDLVWFQVGGDSILDRPDHCLVFQGLEYMLNNGLMHVFGVWWDWAEFNCVLFYFYSWLVHIYLSVLARVLLSFDDWNMGGGFGLGLDGIGVLCILFFSLMGVLLIPLGFGLFCIFCV